MIIDWKIDSMHYKKKVEKSANVKKYLCPICKRNGTFRRHGYYYRNVVCWLGYLTEHRIRILRVICSVCKHTHAILPLDVIPHKIYTITFYHKILRMYYVKKRTEVECSGVLRVTRNQISKAIRRYEEFLRRFYRQTKEVLLYIQLSYQVKKRRFQLFLYYTTLVTDSHNV